MCLLLDSVLALDFSVTQQQQEEEQKSRILGVRMIITRTFKIKSACPEMQNRNRSQYSLSLCGRKALLLKTQSSSSTSGPKWSSYPWSRAVWAEGAFLTLPSFATLWFICLVLCLHCKSSKLPWHHNIKLSFWSLFFCKDSKMASTHWITTAK